MRNEDVPERGIPHRTSRDKEMPCERPLNPQELQLSEVGRRPAALRGPRRAAGQRHGYGPGVESCGQDGRRVRSADTRRRARGVRVMIRSAIAVRAASDHLGGDLVMPQRHGVATGNRRRHRGSGSRPKAMHRQHTGQHRQYKQQEAVPGGATTRRLHRAGHAVIVRRLRFPRPPGIRRPRDRTTADPQGDRCASQPRFGRRGAPFLRRGPVREAARVAIVAYLLEYPPGYLCYGEYRYPGG